MSALDGRRVAGNPSSRVMSCMPATTLLSRVPRHDAMPVADPAVLENAPEVPVEVREWISPAPASSDLMLGDWPRARKVARRHLHVALS
jgi:hypothetical protein